MLKSTKHGFVMATAMALSLPTIVYSANTSEIRGTMIPASLCQPADSESASKGQLDDFWRFKGSETGTIYLRCPLPVSSIRATTDAPYNFIEYFKVLHLDSDGANTSANITVEFRKRSAGQNTFIGPIFDSNSYGSTSIKFKTVNLNAAEVMSNNQFYWFRVTLNRDTVDKKAEFFGISFY